MHQLLFVTLPVADLARSRAFFTSLGYTFNEDLCDTQGLCLELGPTLHALLLRRELVAGMHGRPLPPPEAAGALLCLTAHSRAQVDELAERALAGGGAQLRTQDDGGLYGRTWSDPDGHVWEVLWTELPGAASGPGAGAGARVGTRAEEV